MIPLLATAVTFLRNFAGPCLWVALGGAVVAGSLATCTTKRVMEGKVVRAEAKVTELRLAQANAEKEAAEREIQIRDEVRAEYAAKLSSIDVLAADVRRLRGDVRVCASVSSMPIPGPTAGAGEEGRGEQPRPAETVLGDLAASIAERCDRQAEQLNSLIDWLAKH